MYSCSLGYLCIFLLLRGREDKREWAEEKRKIAVKIFFPYYNYILIEVKLQGSWFLGIEMTRVVDVER